MNKRACRWIFWCLLKNFTRYSLTFFLTAVFLSESVGATPRGTGLQIAQQSEAVSEQTNRVKAVQALAEGKRLYQQGTAESLRKAIEKLQEALKLWRQVDDKRGEAYSFILIGLVYSDLGENQKALDYYNQALPLLRAVGDKGGEVTTLNSIGRLYSNLGENQKALDYYNQALPLLRAVGDKGQEATTLKLIGKIYSNLGENQKALEFYNQALPLSGALHDPGGEARTLNNIGTVYSNLSENQKALEFYNQALPLLRAVGDRDGEALTLNNIGLVYSDLGDNQKALEFYNQALLLLRAVGDRGGEATTLNNIGTAYDYLGENQKALKSYNQALPLYQAVGDRGREANTLNNIGAVYSNLGEKQKALDYYNQALPVRRAVGDRSGEASTLNNIGKVYFDLGENQKALSFYNQALPLRRAVGDLGGEALTLYNIANFERDRGNLQVALTQIEAVIKIIEDLRTKVASAELRTSYFAYVQSYYQFYIDLLMQLHKQNPSKGYDAEALNASERSRARSLLELLTEAHADIRKGVEPQLLVQERSLQQQLDAKAKLLQELPSNQQTQAPTLKKDIENLLDRYKQLQTKIRTTNPKYANLKYPQPLTLPQIQQQLDKDTLLLQYSLGKKHSYLWAVTPNSIASYELPKGEQIEKAALDLYNKLLAPGIQGLFPEETAESANKLSQLILARVADNLGQKRLVIVGDDALQYIPFAALTVPGKSAVASNYQPLVVNHEIISLPSASTIAILRQELIGRTKAPKTLAILADPVFSKDDQRVTDKSPKTSSSQDLQLQESALKRSLRHINRNEFDRLYGTRREAQEILKLVSPKDSLQAFDFEANYNWATGLKLSQYRMLHFATHGFVDPINPELSGIVFSLVDKQGLPQRGFLRLNDIFNLNFPAELVVLSACETGLGKQVKGEGLVGLTRGLMYAGTPRVVVSLWSVNDDATSLLMSQFYSEMLQHGLTPAAALRAAQLKMSQDQKWRNPYYWAAFTLQGEWR